MKHFSKTLLTWYGHYKRELPWRGETDPYKIWISEIILQQTRIAQGWNYYLRFIERFPTVTDLAASSEDEVLKYWQGLGYYSRARNLHTGAKYIMNEHKGIFPTAYKDILKIKGVGEYTASAIASIAFNLPYAAIDGNAFRVLTRMFGIDTPIDTTAAKKEITVLASQLMDTKHAGLFNQALMDFGSLQCLPAHPDCDKCCFVFDCVAKQRCLQNLLPVKSQKQKVRTRYFYYFRIYRQTEILIRKREEKDIWKGLYEFPLFEREKELSEEEILSNSFLTGILDGCTWTIKSISSQYKHQLTHQLIIARFITLTITKGKPHLYNSILSIPEANMDNYPVARLIERFFSYEL
ncbi:MAG: A/G-specific adenine glycosylase [Bacteroidales bacterium]|jgi:A/G-specific adenine glycosylase|nr:A/G-specific adenine glycosylase [Bacteroidales bacterium]